MSNLKIMKIVGQLLADVSHQAPYMFPIDGDGEVVVVLERDSNAQSDRRLLREDLDDLLRISDTLPTGPDEILDVGRNAATIYEPDKRHHFR